MKSKKRSYWWLKAFLITLFLAFIFGFFTETLVSHTQVIVAIIFLVVFVLLSIFFDVIGIAVTACKPEPFMAMASRKIRGSKTSLWILKHAEKVSTFCNDILGDIFGILSGALGAAIVMGIMSNTNDDGTDLVFTIVSVSVSAATAAFSVGGKAYTKGLAMKFSHGIVQRLGVFISYFRKENKKR